jgi:hypothetical protein
MRIAVGVVLSLWLAAAEAIRCYQCDQFPEAAANRPCPGPRVIDFGTKFDVSLDNICMQAKVTPAHARWYCSLAPRDMY